MRTGGGGSSQDVMSPQDRSDCSMRQSQEVPKSQEGRTEAVSGCEKGTEMAGNEASTLRQALLGAAAAGDKFTQFRCRRGKTAELTERSGVYCVRVSTGGRKQVGELRTTFAQSANVCTGVDKTSPTEEVAHLSAIDLSERKLATTPFCGAQSSAKHIEEGKADPNDFHQSILTNSSKATG